MYPECPHLELYSVDEPSTFVTLIATGLWVVAVRTRSFYKAVCQEALAVFTTQLFNHVFHQETMIVEAPEDILGYPERIKDETYFRGCAWDARRKSYFHIWLFISLCV